MSNSVLVVRFKPTSCNIISSSAPISFRQIGLFDAENVPKTKDTRIVFWSLKYSSCNLILPLERPQIHSHNLKSVEGRTKVRNSWTHPKWIRMLLLLFQPLLSFWLNGFWVLHAHASVHLASCTYFPVHLLFFAPPPPPTTKVRCRLALSELANTAEKWNLKLLLACMNSMAPLCYSVFVPLLSELHSCWHSLYCLRMTNTMNAASPVCSSSCLLAAISLRVPLYQLWVQDYLGHLVHYSCICWCVYFHNCIVPT